MRSISLLILFAFTVIISFVFIVVVYPFDTYGSDERAENSTLSVITKVFNHELNDSESIMPENVTVNVQGANPSPGSFQGSATPVRVSLSPGQYSVNVNQIENYLVSMSDKCRGTVAANEEKNCTIFLDYIAPVAGPLNISSVRVITHVINDDGGSNSAADFLQRLTFREESDNPISLSFFGDESPGVDSLIIGDHTVNQTNDNRYNSTLVEYASIFGLSNCESKASIPETPIRYTCIIINDDKPNGGGELNVMGETINDNGATNVAEDFIIMVNGTDANPREFFTNERPGMLVTISPGNYTVSENPIYGYSVRFEGDCHGEMRSWETKVCKVINDDRPTGGGLLKVISRVIGEEAIAVGDSIIIIDDGLVVNSLGDILANANNSGNIGDANDTITIDEIDLNALCPENVACPVAMNPVNLSNITVRVSGTDVYPSEFIGRDLPGKEVVLESGNYSVTADDSSIILGSSATRYINSLSPGCSGFIENGQAKLCVITFAKANEGPTADLIVVQRIVNSVERNESESAFSRYNASVSGNCVEANCNWTKSTESRDPFPFSISEYKLFEGAFEVNSTRPESEPNMAYNITFAGSCSGIINPGELKTCLVTYEHNPSESEKSANLVIKHTVINDNGGNKTSDDFTIYVGPSSVAPDEESFQATQNKVLSIFPERPYIVTINGTSDYESTFSRDCTGRMEANETNVCLITSNDN